MGSAIQKTYAIIVMGVSGCGKSTVGQALAIALGCEFLDADDFHPANNKAKMKAGIALTDDDRAPWLQMLNEQLRTRVEQARSVVLACSALKHRYRHVLGANLPTAQFIHLTGTQAEIEQRLSHRTHEYMPASLLASQFAALEPPTEALQIPVAWTLEAQVSFARNAILGDNSRFVGV
jgi:gluconokinase